MDASKFKIFLDFSPAAKIYEDGTLERLFGTEIAPPSLDPNTQTESKDVIYSAENNLSSRLYLPKSVNPNKKLPLLVYFHGGGFCICSPFFPAYHNYLNTLAAEANIVIVSVEYRRAPEHHLPAAYDDSWTALKWIASHVDGNGPESWLNNYVAFEKVFLAGDSAGANIAHQMAIKNGIEKLMNIDIIGIILFHPFFWGKEPIGDESKKLDLNLTVEKLWHFINPNSIGMDDPLVNPSVDPNLSKIGCSKVLVMVAEKDELRNRAWHYYESLKKSGWEGEIEIMETKDEDHVFHLQKPTCDNSIAMLEKVVSFLKQSD